MAEMNADQQKIAEAVAIATECGQIGGDHHKMCVIDQMVRVLTGDKYEAVIAEAKAGEDGPDTYGWDCGIPP